MKIALYIEDGLEQIVLTPETETERGIVGKLSDGSRTMSIKRGSFYDCRGGWKRHKDTYTDAPWLSYEKTEDKDDSTIIVLSPAVKGEDNAG